MREGWRGKGPPAVSMQRGNWSSFWRKTLLLLWCARGLTVEIRPLLNKSRRRAESVIGSACFYNEEWLHLFQSVWDLFYYNLKISSPELMPIWLKPYFLFCKHSDEHGDRHGQGNSRSVRFHIFLWTASHLHCFLIMIKKYFFVFPDLIDYCLDYLRADMLLTWSSIITLEPNLIFFFFLQHTVFLAWGHRKEKSISFNRKWLNQVSTYWNTHKLKDRSLKQRWTFDMIITNTASFQPHLAHCIVFFLPTSFQFGSVTLSKTLCSCRKHPFLQNKVWSTHHIPPGRHQPADCEILWLAGEESVRSKWILLETEPELKGEGILDLQSIKCCKWMLMLLYCMSAGCSCSQ